jgi:AcrR family transcriptional regulator
LQDSPKDTFNEREKILELSHEKFIREGFYRTSMDEIARELQMSKKTIYKHFPSKDDLLDSVCELRIANAHSIMSGIADSDKDCVTKFILILNVMKKNAMNCSDSWFRDLKIHAPHLQKKFDEIRARTIFQVMTRLIEQGKREKLIENIPPIILITAYIGAIEGVTSSDFIMNSKFTMTDAMRITAEIFLNGFLTPLGREKYSNTKKILENALQ